MSNKIKFTNKYENYKTRKGKIFKEESVTDKSKASDVDIYACLEKYGISALARQTMAKELLYADVTNQPKTIAEALDLRKQLNTYFEQQPARVRKQFGDNADIFYEKFRNGDFNEMLNTGILNEELAKSYKEVINYENSTTTQTTGNSENIPTDTNQGNSEPLAGN